MAARVNTKFVVVLGAVLLLLFSGVAYLGVQAVEVGACSSLGDRRLPTAGYTETIGFYAKAVFKKDQKNAAWIRKWITAMEKYVPNGRAAYIDEYQKQYIAALRAAAGSGQGGLAAHKRYLSEIYTSVVERVQSRRT